MRRHGAVDIERDRCFTLNMSNRIEYYESKIAETAGTWLEDYFAGMLASATERNER